ncbi:hypothetical protein [Rothia sp. 32237D007AR]
MGKIPPMHLTAGQQLMLRIPHQNRQNRTKLMLTKITPNTLSYLHSPLKKVQPHWIMVPKSLLTRLRPQGNTGTNHLHNLHLFPYHGVGMQTEERVNPVSWAFQRTRNPLSNATWLLDQFNPF